MQFIIPYFAVGLKSLIILAAVRLPTTIVPKINIIVESIGTLATIE